MSDAFSLVLDGDLELCGGEDENGAFWFETLAQGASFGDPAPVEVAIASLLRDGSLVERTSDGNRAVTFQIKIKSTDPAGVAEGRARLDRLLGKRTTLVWRDGDYPATVFDVETSSAVRPSGFDDLEYLRNEETVALRFECLPFSRSLEPIVDDADTPASDGGTLLYNCESATGWSQWQTGPGFGGNGTGTEYAVDTVIFAEGAGSMRAKPGYSFDGYEGSVRYLQWINYDRVNDLSLSTGTGGYLAVKIATVHAEAGVTSIWMTTATGGEVAVSPLATGRDAAGFVRYVWPVDAGLTVTGLRFQLGQRFSPYTSSSFAQPYVRYDDVRLLPSATTDKQIVKQLDVQGSARTTGSLLVAAPADEVALGKVLVVTAPTDALPSGYAPDARRWVTGGTTTADTDAPSGSYYSPNGLFGPGGPTFDVPAAMYTAGPYVAVLSARIDSSTAQFGARAVLLVDGSEVGDGMELLLQREGQVLNEYGFFPLGVMYLPPLPVLAPDADVRVRFEFGGTSGGSTRIDNLYLIPAWSVGGRPVADFSIIGCGSGTVAVGGPSSHLWIDSPSASQPQGGYWRGPDATKQLAVSAWPDATKPGLHVFEPGGLTAFVVSTEAQGPRVELTYFPAWHGSAAI